MEHQISHRIVNLITDGSRFDSDAALEMLDAAERAHPVVRDAVHLAISDALSQERDAARAADVRSRLAADISVTDTVERLCGLASDPAASSSTLLAYGTLLDRLKQGPLHTVVRPDGSANPAAAITLAARAARGDMSAAAALTTRAFRNYRKYSNAYVGIRERQPGLAELLEPFRPQESAIKRRFRQTARAVRRGEPAAILAGGGALLAVSMSMAIAAGVSAAAPRLGQEPSGAPAVAVIPGLFDGVDAEALAGELAGRAVVVLPGERAEDIETFLSGLPIEGGVLVGPDAAERAFGQPIPRGIPAVAWMTPSDADRLLRAAGVDPAATPAVVVHAVGRAGGGVHLRITSMGDMHRIASVLVPAGDGIVEAPPMPAALIDELDRALRQGSADLQAGMARIRQGLTVAKSDLDLFRLHAAAALLHIRFAPDGANPLEGEAAAHARRAVVHGEAALSRMETAEAERLGRLKQIFSVPPGLELPAALEAARGG